jgi:predicted CXXCH cytochrome family protein
LKRAKFWLSVGLPLLALVWIGWHGFARDSRVYSSGRMSEAHAVLEADCAACHIQTSAFSARAADSACLSCHDGPIHHTEQIYTPNCTTCHTEHHGRVTLSATGNEVCSQCHARLLTRSGNSPLWAHIPSFENGHPEFAALRPVAGAPASDPGTIKVNHAIHMKSIRRGPNGPSVQLECGDCHRATADDRDATYADPKYSAAAVSYKESDEVLPIQSPTLGMARTSSGRELMAPVRFAVACAACHLLSFDKRFDEGAPHDKPEVVHAFLVKEFREYIAAHPGELRETREPGRGLTGRPVQAAVRAYTPNEWVGARTNDAEELLWRKTCNQCHALTMGGGQDKLPVVEPARTTVKWMPHAKFDHDAHRGFACAGCHEKALNSTQTSDVLLPRIASCKKCHAPGPEHAESRCFECHTYHDWSKRKEVNPTFTLPGLRPGGR